MTEVAPFRCIVCGKPVREGECTYFAGSTPVGGMACEGHCTATATARFRAHQRLDGRGPLHGPNRNDPCPCGSGKKWKKCHMLKDAAPMQCGVPDCHGAVAQVQSCTACTKRYSACRDHAAEISQAMQGHIMRVHPERLSDKVIDLILADPTVMADLEKQRAKEPDLWKALFARLAERKPS